MAMGRRAQADHPEPLCRLVRFAATDGVELAGLLYEPKRPTPRAAVWLHGTGGASIFDTKRTNLLAEELIDRGIAFFPFNNRGAHLIRRLKQTRGTRSRSIGGGMAHERIRNAVHDIDGAARFLRARGHRELILIGHSTGANKIAVYDHYKPRNPFKRYVLLAGGDDTGLTVEQLGARRLRSALEKARAMIKEKRGDELVPRTLSSMPLSWRAFLDMNNPDGDYNVFPFGELLTGERLSRRAPFRYVKAIRKPSLYVYGDSDEFVREGSVQLLSEQVGPNAEIVVMADANHGFNDRERELATLITEWLEA